MDYGTAKKAIKDDTRVNLLGNKLVLIAPKDSKLAEVKVGSGSELANAIGDGRIATGEVNSVPVGKYAKSALEKLGTWASVEKKFAMADNVRAAMALVSRGEAVLGIVYETDAKVDPNVKIVGAFPADSHRADRLSGRRDGECEAGGCGLSQLPAQRDREGRVRTVWLQLPDPPDVVTPARHRPRRRAIQ